MALGKMRESRTSARSPSGEIGRRKALAKPLFDETFVEMLECVS